MGSCVVVTALGAIGYWIPGVSVVKACNCCCFYSAAIAADVTVAVVVVARGSN